MKRLSLKLWPALPSHLIEKSLNIAWSIYPIGTGAQYVFKHGGEISQHRRLKTRDEVIQFDFTFISEPTPGDQKATVLCGIDIQTSFSFAAKIPSKTWTHQTNKILTYVLQTIGGKSGWLQTDNGESIKVLSRNAINNFDGVSIRFAPTYSSQSQGSVGMFNLPIGEQIRTYRLVADLQ